MGTQVEGALRGVKHAGLRNLLGASVLVASLALLVLVWKWGGPSFSVGSAQAGSSDSEQDAQLDALRAIASDTRVALVEIKAALVHLQDLPDRVRALEIKAGGPR